MDSKRAVDTLYATAHWLLSEERPRDAASVLRAMVLASPGDERGWLGLGACHEALEQPEIALEMYGTGRVFARPSPRCEIALARIFRAIGQDDKADEALDRASDLTCDDEVEALLQWERRAA
jgi:cytochrome c-type biogenesis protein CcmH/NrfG